MHNKVTIMKIFCFLLLMLLHGLAFQTLQAMDVDDGVEAESIEIMKERLWRRMLRPLPKPSNPSPTPAKTVQYRFAPPQSFVPTPPYPPSPLII